MIAVEGTRGLTSEYRRLEDRARAAISDQASELVGQFAEPIRDRLGAGFEVEGIEVRPADSFTVSVVIAATVPVAIFYGNIRSGLRFLLGDIRWLVNRFVERFGTAEFRIRTGEGEVVPGPGLFAAETRRLPPTTARPDVVVLYMMATNAVLVIALLALAAVLLIRAS